MADHLSIADTAAAVMRHLDQLGARVTPPVPVALRQPVELGVGVGIGICLWRISDASRNVRLDVRSQADAARRSAIAFDLHFIAACNAPDVARHHEWLGWLLWALASYPVVSDDAEGMLRLTMEQFDPAGDLGIRAALGSAAPLIGFVAQHAVIDLGTAAAVPPVRPLRRG